MRGWLPLRTGSPSDEKLVDDSFAVVDDPRVLGPTAVVSLTLSSPWIFFDVLAAPSRI